eukprot:scaffold51_cov172-Ochromonas_danica.AAC.4
MFEAKILQGAILKKIIEAIRELVTDANLDCNERGITMQAMDSSHVSLCAILLKSEGFDNYRCDKPFALGINTPNLAKILKCAGNDDVVTLKCEEETDTLTLVFESPSQDRISDFDFKLMDIESDLGTGNIMLKKNTTVEKDDDAVVIDMKEPVELNFALRYLNLFTKATALGPTVTLSLSPDIPIVIEYPVDTMGHIRYYLAPKIDEE